LLLQRVFSFSTSPDVFVQRPLDALLTYTVSQKQDLKTQLENYFNDFTDTVEIIAPTCTCIGLPGTGIIYVGADGGRLQGQR
jgi:hypothetical protein